MAKNSLLILAMQNVYEDRCKYLEELYDKRTEKIHKKLAEIEALREQLKRRRAEHINAEKIYKEKSKYIDNRHMVILDLKRSLVNVQTSNQESERTLCAPYEQRDIATPKKEGRMRRRAIRTATSLRYVKQTQDGSKSCRKQSNQTARSGAVGPRAKPPQ